MPAKDSAVKFKFNPTQDGSTKVSVLGELESQIMQVVWEMRNATASDVHHELQASRQRENRDIAYTTVMTTMSRLFEKNILTRRKVGMSFVYTPVLGQDEFITMVVKNVMDSLVGEFGEPVFKYFVDYVAQDEGRRQQMNRALSGPVASLDGVS